MGNSLCLVALDFILAICQEIELPIGGKKGRGAKAARSALKNMNSSDKASIPPPVPRSTPPRSATAPAYQSPSKAAQIAAASSVPTASALQAASKLAMSTTVPLEDIQPASAQALPSSVSLPSQPVKVRFKNILSKIIGQRK